MPGLDPVRLARTLFYLLRFGHNTSGLNADEQGYFVLAEVARVTSTTIRRPVRPEDVAGAATRYGQGRFEVGGGRIRVMIAPMADPHGWSSGPDILYHATSSEGLERYRGDGVVSSARGGLVHLSPTETHAWRVAHRHWEDPKVLYVDASRARRDGHSFGRAGAGLYYVSGLPIRYVLNLREGFAEQASAGGFLVDWTSGVPRIALIRVARRNAATWEVAKGKIEPGETPNAAAVREVREEMGVEAPLRVSRTLGTIRYGFSTPEGDPRLKTIYLYVLEVDGYEDAFRPARAEGIDAVRWFSVEDALIALAHPSLRSSIGRLLSALEDRASELGLAPPLSRAG